jgi:GT2 family glycosyltransferase
LESFTKYCFSFQIPHTNVLKANEYETVDWINGAFLMVKKSAIQKAGLMDEDFFLYAEEVEWCARLKNMEICCLWKFDSYSFAGRNN